MVVVQFPHTSASIKDYHWVSSNKSLERMLNSYLDPTGKPTYDPGADLTEAKRMAEMFKGKITRQDLPVPYTQEGLDY